MEAHISDRRQLLLCFVELPPTFLQGDIAKGKYDCDCIRGGNGLQELFTRYWAQSADLRIIMCEPEPGIPCSMQQHK